MFGNAPRSEKPAMPTFDELLGALPTELKAEFDTLGSWVADLPLKYPGHDGERSVDLDGLTPEERQRHTRFTELTRMATESLKQDGWTPSLPSTGLLEKFHKGLVNALGANR